MRSPYKLLTISFLFISVISGCASLPSLPFTRIENINNQQREYALIRKTPPVVVFENGSGANMSSWGQVFTELGEKTTVFAYNRPGYGKSDTALTPRDGAHIVEELRANLRTKGLQPPYILVGHSLGGLYMQLFARKYPDDVAGLVLVDSTCPTYPTVIKEKVSWWVRFKISIFLSSSQKEELATAIETNQQVLSLPIYSGKPVIILSANYDSESESAQLQKSKQSALHLLYLGSSQTWVNKSGHFIQLDKPEVVIQAIQDVLRFSEVRREEIKAVKVEKSDNAIPNPKNAPAQ